jgi:septum formation protein
MSTDHDAMTLMLASGSPTRAAMLTQAGLIFERVAPEIDERAVEEVIADTGLEAGDVAQILADVKAGDVSARFPAALVIGADQTLSLGGRRFNKPVDIDDARRQLTCLSGHIHQLHSAVSVVRAGNVLFRHLSTARLSMRSLSPMFIGQYLAIVGDQAINSVGCYQIESFGIQLFDDVEGDHFTILGLPLLPLLGFLRAEGEIDA